MTITEQQFYDMLNVDEHMNFTNRIQELVFDKKGREEFYSKILNIHHKIVSKEINAHVMVDI